MATGIDSAIVMTFQDQFDAAYQQRIQRLRQHVRVKTGVVGNQVGFDVLGESAMVDITGQRHALTPWIDPQNTRRWAAKSDFVHPVMLD